ncbi:hypothetical protein CPB85DRAFT_1444549 [Mucidula mucida]|nr:hypothetical protein CPB85DRAFT_1444549 [Mucidula mucida]
MKEEEESKEEEPKKEQAAKKQKAKAVNKEEEDKDLMNPDHVQKKLNISNLGAREVCKTIA